MGNEETERLKKELEEARQKNIELSGQIIELTDKKNEVEESLNRIKGSKLYKMSRNLMKYSHQRISQATMVK